MSETWQTTELHLLRHGECDGGHIFRGATDVALSAHGRQQMQTAVNHVIGAVTKEGGQRNSAWDVVVSSPLRRCYDFAREISSDLGVELVVEEDLREMSFGDWDGQLIDAVRENYSQDFLSWLDDPMSFAPPNGEMFGEVDKRVQVLVDRLLQNHAGKRLLLVTHGGVIRVILARVLNLSGKGFRCIEVPYACLSNISVYHGAGEANLCLTAHNYCLTTHNYAAAASVG